MGGEDGVLRRIVGNGVGEGGKIRDVLVVEPLDLEVKIHVVGRLAQTMAIVLWGRQVDGKLISRAKYSRKCLS